MSIELRSDAFGSDEPIPERYTRDGENVSPPLRWSKLPEGTRELAIIVDDPDAPTRFVHWIAYKIPPEAGGLPEGVQRRPSARQAAVGAQGRNSFRNVGYDGPAPPRGDGAHHYHFHVYALDEPLPGKDSLDERALRAAMRGHVLDEGELVGTYER